MVCVRKTLTYILATHMVHSLAEKLPIQVWPGLEYCKYQI